MIHMESLADNIWKVIYITCFLWQATEAMVRFVANEQLVNESTYIVVAKVQVVSDTGKTIHWRETKGSILRNKLEVIEWVKSAGLIENTFVLYALKFYQWMEDNAVLLSKGSRVLLFLKKDEKGGLQPVGGIQGVWTIDKDGNSSNGTTKEIREMVRKQKDPCTSQAFTTLLNTAEHKTQTGHYKEAPEVYRKAYAICPMRDLEGPMAWLLGEVGGE